MDRRGRVALRRASVTASFALLFACGAGGTEGERVVVGLPPGAEAFGEALDGQLRSELASRPKAFEPRTRHRDSAGRALFTNRLALESSPYLLQHAHNPVNWYPWGDEAFEAAERLGRPVLLSIGYSTCHWCHVMEEESFEDLEIAEYLNRHYIAIKVDREERPDLDAIYMAAVQSLTGRGGWPMTTWLTPEREVFYGGTYFPPRKSARSKRPGFLELLRQLETFYRERPEAVASQAERLVGSVRAALTPRTSEKAPNNPVGAAVERWSTGFDPVNGGIARAPKFPSDLPVRLLMHRYRTTGEERLREMALTTLDRMASVGLFDHVGGGFHRYSTDRTWLVPHFEKMLYDNALLAPAYVEAWQLTGDARFRQVAVETLGWLQREMSAPDGGFYSATDADSIGPHGEREEGYFFTWTPVELEAALGAPAATRFAERYGVDSAGNFEQRRTILHLAQDLATIATRHEMTRSALADELERSRARLYAVRGERTPPLRDDKVLAAWNGLALSAFSRAGFAFDDPGLLDRARRNARFLVDRMVVDKRLRRQFADGKAKGGAFLDDYAFVVAGLIDLFLATSESEWLDDAIALQAQLDAHFADAEAGGYFMTADDHERLLVREKPQRDGAEPSGNSVALMNLLRLHVLTGAVSYRESADRTAIASRAMLARAPSGAGELLRAVEFDSDAKREVVLVGSESARAPFVDAMRMSYEPQRVAIFGDLQQIEAMAERVPWLAGKRTRRGRATAYVCEDRVCQLPTTDLAVFRKQLERPPTEESAQ